MTTNIYTADELETLFHECLKRGDAKGVEAALTLMCGKDPARAATLYDDLKTAIQLRRIFPADALSLPETRKP